MEFLIVSPLIPIWSKSFSKIISLFLNKNFLVGWEFEFRDFVEKKEFNVESSWWPFDSGVSSDTRRPFCCCGGGWLRWI